jgi:hypothetical protein
MNEIATRPDPIGHATATLAEVSQELAAWVPMLRQLAEAEALRNLVQGHSFEITASTVRSVIAARRLRDEYFWPMMSENAWSVLLELFASRLDGRRLDVNALRDATRLTDEAALHWVDWMAARNLVTRKYAEGEQAPVDLTDTGADGMRAYLLAALSLSPWAA